MAQNKPRVQVPLAGSVFHTFTLSDHRSSDALVAGPQAEERGDVLTCDSVT